MKKLTLLSLLTMMIAIVSCNQKNTEVVVDEEFVGLSTEDSLRLALANQDSLLSLINDITADMNNIKQMEDIMNSTGLLGNETTSERQRIHDDMVAIQNTLQQRRERLAELERKLSNAAANNRTLQQTIETLRTQISDQENTITALTDELAKKNIIIEQKTIQIDSLETRLNDVSEAKELAELENVKLTDDLNTCFYVVGNKKELNNNSIIKSGFLRKTKILPGDVDTQFFTKADKRSLVEINCRSRKAKVLTNQPQSSYEFTTEANGDKILVIKDANEFWKKSDFLVIRIN